MTKTVQQKVKEMSLELQGERLMYLWDKHAIEDLISQEWDEFYILTVLILARCTGSVSLLKQLPETAQYHYDTFFMDVIFIRKKNKILKGLSSKTFKLERPQSLCHFFKNYLLSLLKKLALERTRYISPDDNENIKDDIQNKPNNSLDESKRTKFLSESGLDKTNIEREALIFFEQQEYWVPIYLKYHYCADKAEKIAMQKLIIMYGIPSYHHKAIKLGVIQKKKGISDIKAYKKTALGKWLLSLNIDITHENRSLIYVAFEILCSQAAIY